MKRMMIALAIMGLAIGAMAEQGFFGRSTATVWTRTFYTNVVTVGGDTGYKLLEKFAVKNNTGSATSYILASEDSDGQWTTLHTNTIAAAGAYVGGVTNTMSGSVSVQPFIPVNRVRFIFEQATTNVPSTITSAVFAK